MITADVFREENEENEENVYSWVRDKRPEQFRGTTIKFTLIYRGALPPDKTGVASEKQSIRVQFHPQLREFWQIHPYLKHAFTNKESGKSPIDDIANNFDRAGFRFVPFVRKHLRMGCRLQIHMMRRQDPHKVFQGTGDLDNRIKTLIDALTMPIDRGQTANTVPTNDQDPFFVLLENDDLVSEFEVTTARLLSPPEGNEEHGHAVALIKVSVEKFDDPAGLVHLGSAGGLY